MPSPSIVLFMACLLPGSAIQKPPTARSSPRVNSSEEAEYHVLRAMLHARDHDWEKCNMQYKQAARQRPRDPYLYMHWGNAALQLNQKEDAILRYQEALDRFGKHRPDLRAKIESKIEIALR